MQVIRNNKTRDHVLNSFFFQKCSWIENLVKAKNVFLLISKLYFHIWFVAINKTTRIQEEKTYLLILSYYVTTGLFSEVYKTWKLINQRWKRRNKARCHSNGNFWRMDIFIDCVGMDDHQKSNNIKKKNVLSTVRLNMFLIYVWPLTFTLTK